MEQPKIVEIPERKLVGVRAETSLAQNKTPVIWQQFMPRRNEIKSIANNDLYSMRIYDNFNPKTFTPETLFEEWAAIEVTEFRDVPEGMITHIVTGGKYSVFIHKGIAGDFPKVAQYIFGTWLPMSGYKLDNREHFAIMGEKYLGHDNPDSAEEIWVPIK